MNIDNMQSMATSQLNSAKVSNAALNTKFSKSDDKLKEACKQFEAIFIKQMLNSMKKTVQKSGLIDGGQTEKIFEDMLYDKYADKMSNTGNFGIAKNMYNQLSMVNEYSKNVSQIGLSDKKVGLEI